MDTTPVKPAETDYRHLIQSKPNYFKKVRADRKFRQRTFLTETRYVELMDGPIYPPSDRIQISLSHKCSKCLKTLNA